MAPSLVFGCFSPFTRRHLPLRTRHERHSLSAIGTIQPCIAQSDKATGALIAPGPFPTSLPDHGEDHSCNQVSGNDKPANRRDLQKIIDHTMTEVKQAKVTCHDGKNACQAEADKPGESIFPKDLLHDTLGY